MPSLKILDIFSLFSLVDFGITPSQISVTIDLQDIVYFLGLSVVIIFIHELLHLFFVPDFLTSDKAFLGITYFGGFAYSEEVLSKARFILILLAPFVVISILLPGILGALNLLNPLVKFVILSSAMGFRRGYADPGPSTDPGACRCIFNLQWDENLLEKNRFEHSQK